MLICDTCDAEREIRDEELTGVIATACSCGMGGLYKHLVPVANQLFKGAMEQIRLKVH